jgi:hypothetical protein
MNSASDFPFVDMKFLEKQDGHPPQVMLLFDISLYNRHPEPRWFLLPDNIFSSSGGVKNGGVNGIEVFALSGKGHVVIGHFQGTGGFQALLLPARAQVTIRRFPITVWEKLPTGALPIEVVVANELAVGDEAAPKWFDVNPMSDAQADVSAGQREMLGSKHTTNFKEVPVSLLQDQRMKLQVDLVESGESGRGHAIQ